MDGKKFNRRYILRVMTDENGLLESKWVEIKWPFTCEFTITRNCNASDNTAHFVIYNLNKETRNRIYKDAWDQDTIRGIEFYAGYADMNGGMIPRCFKGTLKSAFSYRSGSDIRTEIEAFDGSSSLSENQISMTIQKGIPLAVAMFTYAKGLENIESVTIGKKFNSVNSRTTSFIGPPLDIFNDATENKTYIDDQSIYMLDKNEVFIGDLSVLNEDNGILGTPKYFENRVEVEMLFEPRLKPSQMLELDSNIENRFNGNYKLSGFTHKGIISGAVSGDCVTNVIMLRINDELEIVVDLNTAEYLAIPFEDRT